jgi:hypothetical protein
MNPSQHIGSRSDSFRGRQEPTKTMDFSTSDPDLQEPTPFPNGPPNPRKNRARRIVFALIVVVALVTAVAVVINRGGGKPSATARRPTPTAPTPSQPSGSTGPTTPTTPTTVVGPSGDPAAWPAAQPIPPSLDSLYDSPPDFIAFVKTLQNYIDWAYSHPDPSLVANYMLPISSYYQGQINDLTYLKTMGWHAPPNPTEIDFIKITEPPQLYPPFNGKPRTIQGRPSYRAGLVVVVINFPGGPLLDAAGNVVKTYPASGQIAYSWALSQGANDGRWRIADEQRLNPSGGIAALEQQ